MTSIEDHIFLLFVNMKEKGFMKDKWLQRKEKEQKGIYCVMEIMKKE